MTFLRVCKIKMNVEDYIVMLVRICISLGQVKNEFFLDNENVFALWGHIHWK